VQTGRGSGGFLGDRHAFMKIYDDRTYERAMKICETSVRSVKVTFFAPDGAELWPEISLMKGKATRQKSGMTYKSF